MNNLKQISLAALSHEAAKKFLPSGGWGNNWIGDPDVGYGRHQPGGWPYSTMMFMEANTILQQTAGLTYNQAITPNKYTMGLQNVAGGPNSAQAAFYCPSRRPVQLYPIPATDLKVGGHYVNMTSPSAGPFQNLARTDYAGNAGDWGCQNGIGGAGEPNDAAGPGTAPSATMSIAQIEVQTANAGTAGNFGGTFFNQATWVASPGLYTGIFWQRSETSLRMVSDGASKVYMVGEKYMSQLDYMLSQSGSGDEETVYCGMDDDFMRITATPGYNYIMTKIGTGVPNANITLPNGPGGNYICPPQQDQAILGGQESAKGANPNYDWGNTFRFGSAPCGRVQHGVLRWIGPSDPLRN